MEPTDTGAADVQIEQSGGEPTPTAVTVEDLAREKGWSDKEAFKGDPEKWVDAVEYLRGHREPILEKVGNYSREIKNLKKTIEQMAKFHNQQVEAQVKKEVAALKAERREAIELGDVARVDAIDHQIHTTVQQTPVAPQNQVAGEVLDWVAENPWFNEDKERRSFAIAYNEAYLKDHPGELEASLQKTLEATKKAFPEKFGLKNGIKPPAGSVESGTSTQRGGKYDVNRLTKEQKMVYKQFVQEHKILSHDDYFKQLEEIGELK